MASMAPVTHRRAHPTRTRRKEGVQRPCRRWGLAPVELAFALPVMLFVLLGAMQAGAITAIQNHMHRVADAVAAEIRAGAVSPEAARKLAHERLAGFGFEYIVQISAGDDTPARQPSPAVSVLIELPGDHIGAIDVLGLYRNRVLYASATSARP